MRITLLQDSHALTALEADWESLLESSRSPSFFLTWDYLSAWLETYGPSATLRFLVARDEQGRLRGVAPLEIAVEPRGVRRFLRQLSFVGCLSEAITEYPGFLVAQDDKPEFIPAVCRAIDETLSADWDLLSLPNLPAGSISAGIMEREMAARGYRVQRHAESPACYVPLPGSWDEFLRTRSKNFRKKLRNRSNRLASAFQEVKVLEAGVDVSPREALETLMVLNEKRWQQGDRASFHTDSYACFHRLLVDRLHDKGRLALFLLRADGRDVAAQYDYLYAGKVWGFQAGWLPEFADYGVGRLLLAECMERYAERGFREYDFLPGEADYKRSWTAEERELIKLEAVNPRSARARLFSAAKTVRDVVQLSPSLARGSDA